MSETTERQPSNDGRGARDLRGLLSSAWILLVLAGIVCWSWLIRVAPDPPPTIPRAEPVRSVPAPPPVASFPAETPSPRRTLPPPTPLDTLASRARADLERLRGAEPWTRQVGLFCSPEAVERILRSPAARPGGRLLVLPATHGGQSCFRLCWGTYASRAAAEAAAVPAEMAGGSHGPARLVSEVAP